MRKIETSFTKPLLYLLRLTFDFKLQAYHSAHLQQFADLNCSPQQHRFRTDASASSSFTLLQHFFRVQAPPSRFLAQARSSLDLHHQARLLFSLPSPYHPLTEHHIHFVTTSPRLPRFTFPAAESWMASAFICRVECKAFTPSTTASQSFNTSPPFPKLDRPLSIFLLWFSKFVQVRVVSPTTGRKDADSHCRHAPALPSTSHPLKKSFPPPHLEPIRHKV